jgi:type I restriction enzyme S subunit
MTTAWPTLALEELASVQRGKFSARPRNDPRYYGGEIPFIQTGDVANGAGRVRSYSQTLNADGLSVSKLFPKGSLVVTIAANIGDVAEVAFDFACPDSLVVVQANEGTDSKWLQYSLESKKALLDSLAPQNAQKNINLEVLRRLPLDVPPLEEQKRIAGGIKTWDTAIETTERLIAAKEVYIGAVTERIYRRSPGWSRYRLGDFLQETKVLHGHGDYVIGSVGKNGIKPRDEVYSKDLTSNHERNLLVKPGWLCFGLASDCMAFGVNSTNQTYSVSPAYRTFQINGADPRFFEGYLRVFNGRLSKRFLITSARQGKAIDFEGLFNTECYFPSREEQQQIASAVLLMREELDHLRQLREALKRQKRGLMQKLLTGKWRIQMEEGVPV